jgi:hypothetical protein
MDNIHDNEELELDELEIEAFSLNNQDRKPRAKVYLIRVDKAIYRVKQPEMTGRAILELAGKVPPESYRLRQKFRNGEMHTIELDTKVDFRAPGLERFVTIPLENTEG